MIRNTFNSMPLTPIRGKVNTLQPNATTDLTKIRLVGSCLLCYGRPYSAGREDLSNELREQIVRFFMTANYFWEYKNNNPFLLSKFIVHLEDNEYPEIFDNIFFHKLHIYFTGLVVTEYEKPIFEGNFALDIMRFLVQNKPIIKRMNSVISKDPHKF
jgi:hypothetical protein